VDSLNKPLVSIIVNCFNGEKFLKESLDSVTNQSYKNWEVIFWDNKSLDNSKKIFHSFKDKRFKYFNASEHTTLYRARNLAIKESRGELIAFIDVDDLWEKNKLEMQVSLFKNAKIAAVYSNLWIIKNNLNKKKLFIKNKSPSGYIYEKLLENYNVGIITAIFRKKAIINFNKIFDERFSIIGDFDFFLKLSKSNYFHYISTPLAYYRIHGGNFSSVYKKKEMIEYDLWLSENKNNISDKSLIKIKKKINLRKFLHFKFEKDYKNSLKILFQYTGSVLGIKMLIIFFTPLYVLRKISWFHS